MGQSRGQRESTHRRREESRERILSAAEDQLREEELELFSVDTVVERAGESVGTFYRTFTSKQALLAAVQDRLHDRVEPRILDALKLEKSVHESLEDAVERSFGILVDNVMSDAQLFRAFALFATFDPTLRGTTRKHHLARRDAITAVLEKHREEIRHPDPDQAIHHAYHLYLATMNGRLMFLRPGAGPIFGVSNEVFFDQLKLSIRNLLVGTDTPPRSTTSAPKTQPLPPLKGTAMKKLINDPMAVVDDTLAGILKAYPLHLRMTKDSPRALVRADAPVPGKVGICTGGGSGHIPVFLGYVGPGLLDGVSVGNVFSSPSADDMLAATKEVDGGAGVLYLYGNYQGDIMNFDMAAEMAELEGITVKTSIARDDVASASKADAQHRRGVAGIFFAYKIAGAKADTMATLDEVKATTDRAIANTCTMGFSLTPCIIPAVGKPTFTIADDEMELGMGIHGEPGVERSKMKTADEIATVVTEKLVSDLPFGLGDEVAVLVNGLGATPPEELFILARKVHDLLGEHQIKIYRTYVGEYATSMEMAGASVSLCKLDDELKALLDAPAYSPFLLQWPK